MPDPLAALLAYSGHELRTPLTSLTLATQMCADGSLGPLTPALAETLAGAAADCSRLRQLIDLLADPVLAGDDARLVRTPIAAQAALAEAVGQVRELAVERGVAIAPPEVRADLRWTADPDRTRRALEQGLVHALHGAHRGSGLTLVIAGGGIEIGWQPAADAPARSMPLWLCERLMGAMGMRVESGVGRVVVG